MSELRTQIDAAAARIRRQYKKTPRVGIILGTGLGRLGATIDAEASIPFEEIPHFPVSTAPGHEGRLLAGTLAGQNVVAMQGRFHAYEGWSMNEITLPVRVMRMLGAEVLVVSNACGNMNPQHRKGEIMVMEDHINLMGVNPLVGPGDDSLGPRFPDMSQPYDRRLIELALEAACEERIPVFTGVYVAVTGPNLETRAEYRFLRAIGADVVGMSTVPEVLVAVHSSMRVLGFSILTDDCFPDALEPAQVETIIRVAEEAEPRLTRLVTRVIRELPRALRPS
ncbi:MAG: purine-nucleoside phosphorylase [Planctomycetes bacterium]|nr:purine-nucleoside phosphorylase [Planctomycetota bacterium]